MNELSVGNIREATASRPTPPSSLAVVPSHLVSDSPSSEDSPESDASSLSPMEWLSPLESPCDLSVISSSHSLTSPGSCIEIPIPGLTTPLVSPSVPSSFHSTTSPSTTVSPSGTARPVHCTRSSPNPKVPATSSGSSDSDSGSGWSTPSPVRSVVSNPSVPCSSQSSPVWSSSSLTSSTSSSLSPPSDVKRYLVATANGRRSSTTDLAQTRATRKNLWENIRANPKLNNSKCSSHCRHGKRSPTTDDDDDSDFSYTYPASPSSRNSPLYRCPVSSGPLLYGPASPISQGPPYQRDRGSRSPSPMPRSRKRSSRCPVSPSHSPGSPLGCSAVGPGEGLEGASSHFCKTPVSASPSPVGRYSKPKDTDALSLKSPMNEVAKSRCNSSDTTKGKRRSVSSVVSNVSISSKAFHKKQNHGASASHTDGHLSPEIVITADNIDIILSDDYSTMDNIETEHNPSIKKGISSKKPTRHLTDFANTSQNNVSRKSQSNLEGEKIKKLGDRKEDGGKEEAGNETSDKDEKIPTKSRKKKARSNSLAYEQLRSSLKENISSSVHNLSGNHSSASNSISYSIPNSLHTICSGSDSSPKHTNKKSNRAVSRSSSRNASRSVSNSLWDLTTRKPLSHCNTPSPSRDSTTNAEKWRRASLGTVGLSPRSRSSTPKDRDGSRRNSVTNTNSGSTWSLWGGGGKSKSITFGPPPPITATVSRATPTLSKTSGAASKTGPSISKTQGAIPKTRNASSSISKVGKVVSNAIRVGNTLKKGPQRSPTSTSAELDLPSVSPGQRLSRKVGSRKKGAALDSRMSPDNGAHIRDASRYSPVRDPANCSHSSRGSTNSLWDSTMDNSANVWDSNFSLKDRFMGSTISLKDSSMGSSMSLHDSAMGSSISLRDSIMGSNNSLRHCSIGSSSSLRDSALGSSTSLVYSTLDSIASYKDSTMGSCTSLRDDLKGSSASLIDMPMASSKSLTDSVLDLSKKDVCKTANISDDAIGNGGMSPANIKRNGSRDSTTSLKDSILRSSAHSSKSMGSTTSLRESTLANTSSVKDVGSITSLKESDMYYRKDGSFENAIKDCRAYSRAKSMTNLRDDSLFNNANSGCVGMTDAYVTRQKDVLMGSATNLGDKAANYRLRHGILGSATNLRDSVMTSNQNLRHGVIGSTTNLREKLTSNTTRLRHGVAGSTTDVRDSYLGRNNSIRHSRNGSTTNIRDNAMGSTVSLRHCAISDLIDSAIGLATDTIFNTNLHDTDESSSSEDENANKIYGSLTNKAMEFLTKERVTDLSKSANSLNGTAAYDLLTVPHGKPDLMMSRCRSAHSLTEPQQSYNAVDHISRTQSSDLRDLIRKDSQRQKLKRGKSLDLRDLPQRSHSRRVLKRGKSCDLRDLPCTESLDTPGSSEIEDSREFLRMRTWEDREVPKAKSWDGKDASQLHESMVNYINQLEGDLQKCSSMQQCSSPTVEVNYGSDCGSDNHMDRGSGEEESAADNTSSHHEFSQNGDTIRSDTPEPNHRRRRRGSADRRSGSGRRQSLDNLNGEELLYALRGRRGSGGSHSHLRGGCAAGGNSWISAIPRHNRKWESLRRGVVDKSIRCSTPKQGRRGSVENICGGMGRKKISSLWDNILGQYVEGELKAKKSLSCSSFKVGGGEEKSEWVTTRDDVDQEEEEEEEEAATTGVLTESGGNSEVVCPQRRAPRFSEIFGGGSIEESRRSRLEMTYGSQDFKDSKRRKRSKDKKRGKMVSSDSDGDFKSASGHSFSRESGLGSSCEEETDYSSGNVTPEGSPSHVGSQKVMAAISHYLRSVDVAESEEDVDSFSKEADHISPGDLMLMSDNEDNFSLSWEDLIISYKSLKYKPNTSKISELENGFENLQIDLENKEASGEVDNPKLDQELDKLLGCDYRQLEGEILSGRSTPARGSKEVVFSSSAKIPSLKPASTDVRRPWSAEPPRSAEKSHVCNESVNNPENHQIDDQTTDEDSKSDSVVTWCSQDKNVSRQSTIVCNEESDEVPDAAEDTSKVPRPPTPDSALGSDCTPLSPVSGEETTVNDATEEEEDVRTRGRAKEQGPQPGLDGARDRSVSCSENIKAFLLSQPCAFAHVAGEDCAHEHTDTCGDKHFYPDADRSSSKQAASGVGSPGKKANPRKAARRANKAYRIREDSQEAERSPTSNGVKAAAASGFQRQTGGAAKVANFLKHPIFTF
ncbi:serine-rich adhesin for platelets-like [Penaeus indicus]|uniref:serine-rich adhesin for platelets-like n=1 Tax=Penaeus indicus TaxID=29960 RepID=UPI00300C537B